MLNFTVKIKMKKLPQETKSCTCHIIGKIIVE